MNATKIKLMVYKKAQLLCICDTNLKPQTVRWVVLVTSNFKTKDDNLCHYDPGDLEKEFMVKFMVCCKRSC